ncbi:MAG: hypothetical protein ACRC10_10740 [Thermoguttaceae bacterium]
MKHHKLPSLLLLFLLIFFHVWTCPVLGQFNSVEGNEGTEIQISGPDYVEQGNLVVFAIAEPADWCIVPVDSTVGKWSVDSSGKSCYFASPEKGLYTVCAAIVVENRVKLLHKTFVNRSGSEPIPPGPEPQPDPDQLTDWVALNVNQVVQSEQFLREKNALIESVQSIVNGLDRGTIRTPSAARTVFRNTISAKLTGLSITSLKNWADFLEKLGKEIEKRDQEGGDNLALIRTLFLEILKGLKNGG